MKIVREIFQFLQIIYIRILATLSVVWFIYTILKEFGTFDIVATPSKSIYLIYAIIGVILLVVIFFVITKLINLGVYYSDKAEIDSLTETLSQRIGTIFSQQTAKQEFIDEKHTFELVYRHDYLDYTTGNYISNRALKGINSSSSPSSCLIYCESTEYKVPFSDVKISAFDNNTGNQLHVECLQDPNTPLITHIFRIHFKTPIQSGESFDISYSIFFPHELKILNDAREIMSISLMRIRRKIGKLVFIVSLEGDFQSVKTFKKKSNLLSVIRRNAIFHGPLKQTDLSVEEYLEKPTIDDMNSIGISIDNPNGSLYVIEYLRCKKLLITFN